MALSARIRFGATRSSTVPSYTRGETVEIWCDFRDEDGALVDVSGVTSLVYWPGGSERTPTLTPTEETAGTWRADVPATLYDGLWKIVFACTSPSAATATAWFSVASSEPDEGPAPAAGSVISVAGRNGSVVLDASDIGYAPTNGGADTTLEAVAHEVRRGRLEDYCAVDATGATDMAAGINAAIVAAIADGLPLIIGPGLYRCESSIIVRTGLHLIASPLAEFRAHFGAAQTTGMVTVPSVADALVPATRQRNITIEGGVWGLDGQIDGDGVWTSNRTATVFLLYADDLHLERVEVNGYGQGRAFQLAGDRVTGRGCNTFNPVRTGGAGSIRYIGGRYFRWSDSYSEAGDDVFMLVPGGAVGSGWNNLSIEDAQYINCTGYSYTARVLVVGLESRTHPGGMSASIRNCAYIGCKGHGGGSSLTVQNTDSGGVIDGLDFVGCTIDDDGNDDRPAAVSIVGRDIGDAGGAVRNVRFFGLDIKLCHKIAFDVDGRVENVQVRGGTWTDPRVTGFYTARIRGLHGGTIDGVEIYGSDIVDAMFIGGVDGVSSVETGSLGVRRSVKNLRVRNCTFRDVPNNQHAIQAGYCDDVQITGNVVKKLAGATTARAVYWWTNSENGWVDRNDFRECGHATPITNIGTNNETGTNLGLPLGSSGATTSTQSAAGGSLAWTTGRTLIRISVAGTVTAISGTPTTAAPLTLRAVHSSGTLTIQHGASAIRLKGSSNVVLAQNDALTLQYDTSNSYWFETARSVA